MQQILEEREEELKEGGDYLEESGRVSHDRGMSKRQAIKVVRKQHSDQFNSEQIVKTMMLQAHRRQSALGQQRPLQCKSGACAPLEFLKGSIKKRSKSASYGADKYQIQRKRIAVEQARNVLKKSRKEHKRQTMIAPQRTSPLTKELL